MKVRGGILLSPLYSLRHGGKEAEEVGGSWQKTSPIKTIETDHWGVTRSTPLANQ